MSRSTERLLQSALTEVAETVQGSPDAYRRAQYRWRREAMKRRAIIVSIVMVLVVIACVAGVWALSGATPEGHVIFGGTGDGGTPFPLPGMP
ncbi:hypothetical protein [Streptomyces sp. NPDC059928]|uniref:hypothetical protein n=1 Tax=unclassified Streptomyces TaxID=2593676 RepID=UPI0036652528